MPVTTPRDAAPLRFAITKIQPPRARGVRVARAALAAAFELALREHRIVLLQAPAGFGKTALLAAQWPRWAADATPAWISLDEDDDAQRLYACLAAALDPADLPWRIAPEALAAQIGDDPATLRRAADELLNALALADTPRGVIVIDDLHRVQSPDAHALLDLLIDRLPARWTLVLSTRVPPPLALARWRAAGELAEFDQTQLRFSAADAQELAAAEAAPAVAERIAELHERTQGWPAGLQLCVAALRTRPLALRGAGAAGGLLDRHLFDYLASEVLDDMPAELRDFLTRSSVLPELSAARAAEVSGDARAAQRLDEIERRGLFVTVLDADERTLVLHDLFRHALEERLLREHPDELPELLRRAAAGEADPLRRVGYLLRASDWPRAEAALTDAAPELLLHGAMRDVQRLAEQFPAAWREASAALLRLTGLVQCLRWQWAEMARSMEGAAAAALAAGDAAGHRLAQAYLATAYYPLGRNDASLALLDELRPLVHPADGAPALAADARAVALLGECTQLFRLGEHDRLPLVYAQLVELLEREGTLFAWWQCGPASSWSTLRGMRPVVQRYFDSALRRIGERALPMRADVQVQRAYALLWGGDLAAALEQAALARADLKWLACSGEMEVGLRLFEMITDAMRGDADAVQARLRELFAREDRGSDERRRLWQHQIAVYGVRLNDVLGGPAETMRHWAGWLNERPLDSDAARTPRAYAVRARYAAAQGRWADAAAAFDEVLPHAPRMDVMGQAVELPLRAAHALLRLGRTGDAAAALRPALDRMRLDGDRGHAPMAGITVLSALAEADWGERLDAAQRSELVEAAHLAQRWRTAGAAAVAPAHAASAQEPAADDRAAAPLAATGAGLLSAREREVLERLAAGDSNKLIARAFDISPHTVKRHVANILDKLDLASRNQAGAWLRANA